MRRPIENEDIFVPLTDDELENGAVTIMAMIRHIRKLEKENAKNDR